MNVENYLHLIGSFVDKGYKLKFFSDEINPKKNLLLRHDIDFDVLLSLKLAEYEYKNSIKSTYFFMLRSDSYNIFTPQNIDAIGNIIELGHKISLHFDPLIYKDYSSGLQHEIELFDVLFGVQPEIISIHRPNDDFLSGMNIGIPHTYEKRFFKDIHYISDSGGEFKYGHPLESDAFINCDTVHLLLHPIWWIVNGEENISKLKTHYKYRCDLMSDHFSQNCIPWRKFVDGENEI